MKYGRGGLIRLANPAAAGTAHIGAGRHPRDTATTYGEAAYQAGTWPVPQRTIIKAEVVWREGREPHDNPRFVITNLRQTPEWIYTHVCYARGDSENRLNSNSRASSGAPSARAFGPINCASR